MDLYILNEIQKLKSGGGGGGSGTATDPMGFESFEADASVDGWSSNYGVNWRTHNSNANWTSNHVAGGNFYAYGNQDANNARLMFWNAKGSITSSTSPNMSYDSTGYRHMPRAVKGSIGYTSQQHTSNSSANYHPIASQVLFVRNPTDQDISTSLSWGYSNGWSSGYEGSSCWTFTPNGDYETTTGGTWTQQISRTSGNSFYNDTFTLVVPAGKTVAVVGCCSSYNWTSSYQASLMITHNQFYDLTALAQAGLVCDHSMTQTFQQFGNTATCTSKYGSDAGVAAIYNAAAAYYGNR